MKLKKIFEEQCYNQVYDITDQINNKDIRKKILNKLKIMITPHVNKAENNPFIVNFITFSGYGFKYNGDLIAAIVHSNIK